MQWELGSHLGLQHSKAQALVRGTLFLAPVAAVLHCLDFPTLQVCKLGVRCLSDLFGTRARRRQTSQPRAVSPEAQGLQPSPLLCVDGTPTPQNHCATGEVSRTLGLSHLYPCSLQRRLGGCLLSHASGGLACLGLGGDPSSRSACCNGSVFPIVAKRTICPHHHFV